VSSLIDAPCGEKELKMLGGLVVIILAYSLGMGIGLAIGLTTSCVVANECR
jgi:hypothetical protein